MIRLSILIGCLLAASSGFAGHPNPPKVLPAAPPEPAGDVIIRAPAGPSEIVITTSHRLAGAIHSLTWNGREFINSADHGRQLQSACSFDNSSSGLPETFNPTEAGSRRDGAGARSTSRLIELAASGNQLKTKTQMAFWLHPGDRSGGQYARNKTALSEYQLTKEVRIGFDRWPQALDYRVTFTVPKTARHTSAQFEALTAYMPPEFSQFWKFNPQTGKLQPLSDGPGEIIKPVILATPDGNFAMGIFSPPPADADCSGPRYGRWNFTTAGTVKWNCVYRAQNDNGIRDGDYSFRMLVAIGTLVEVTEMLKEWHQNPKLF